MTAATVLDQHELRIAIWPGAFVRYEGTRSQLEGEGIIPDGFVWPLSTAEVEFDGDDDDRLFLRRARPPGLKGPRRLWVKGDWWRLQSWPASYPRSMPLERCAANAIKQKKAELAAVVFHFSPLGLAACQRHSDAQDDQSFQNFKSLILGLVPLARGGAASTTTTRPRRQSRGVVGR